MAVRRVDLGVTRLTWVTDLTAPATPDPAELNAGEDLSCLMVTSYEVRADTSDTVSEKAVCETANSDTPTAQNYMGNLVLFRQWNEADAGPPIVEEGWDADTDPVAIFPSGRIPGYFVRRTGLPYDTAYTAGDVVEIYKFVTDEPQHAGGTDQGYIKVTVPLHKQGVMNLAAVVTAP
jgi:hypothetical protein